MLNVAYQHYFRSADQHPAFSAKCCYDWCFSDKYYYAECHKTERYIVMMSIALLSIIMLGVIKLNIVLVCAALALVFTGNP